MTPALDPSHVFNARIDQILVDLGCLAPLGDSDEYMLALVVSKGLWAGFYLALHHPEWFAQVILEGNAIIDEEVYEDLEWDERREWQAIVDRLVTGETL